MNLVINTEGNAPIYNCLLYVNDEKNGQLFSDAVGTTDASGNAANSANRFRTGSITKLFTATIILQLTEEGLVKLEDIFFDLIDKETAEILTGLHFSEQTDLSKRITILDLLQQSSGLADYFSEDARFLNEVMQNPSKLWNWKLIMEKYFELALNTKAKFAPGRGFHYSDTNYLLLGILIEQITKKTFQDNYKEKITAPLLLNDTFLEFYELPYQVAPIVYPYHGINSLENVNTSFDWGGGGLVSTAKDLDIFIRSLMKGQLFKSKESLELLLNTQNSYSTIDKTNRSQQYGLGIQKKEINGFSFYGHTSAYGAMLYYSPERDLSIIFSLNQTAALLKAERLIKKILAHFRET